jgi:hypothetical protein
LIVPACLACLPIDRAAAAAAVSQSPIINYLQVTCLSCLPTCQLCCSCCQPKPNHLLQQLPCLCCSPTHQTVLLQLLLSAKAQLESVVAQRLEEAVAARDHAAVLRFVKLHKPLAAPEKGISRCDCQLGVTAVCLLSATAVAAAAA